MIEPLMENEIREKISELKGWHLSSGSIEKTWKFPSFKDAVGFVNRVVDLAGEMDHHPDITVNLSLIHISEPTRPY